ncbi:MAG: twin-arginine translocase TatA/TatE family subunit [Chloroflexi bacterium]|nr:twin-arginine translocase TatA/TatE family subunit [Chloroflexota bacterium]
MPMGLGPFELIVILLIVVLVFGAGKLGDVGGALGKGIREFRKEASDNEASTKAA